ncbi:EAL domain-containing protein [Leptospira sp. 201903070]|uniref:EAL domain-containing protein n=1 Tax=Leptospira ainlahdjerensis TaxID=2810033 RepID=A0ABS2UC75_9LEPT|nr:EAL domain-containing protein [Leptospira ainlahdjerensis]MBM9577148.1 EAL domain-containing protein [Leptospira ainlahdjerensis]
MNLLKSEREPAANISGKIRCGFRGGCIELDPVIQRELQTSPDLKIKLCNLVESISQFSKQNQNNSKTFELFMEIVSESEQTYHLYALVYQQKEEITFELTKIPAIPDSKVRLITNKQRINAHKAELKAFLSKSRLAFFLIEVQFVSTKGLPEPGTEYIEQVFMDISTEIFTLTNGKTKIVRYSQNKILVMIPVENKPFNLSVLSKQIISIMDYPLSYYETELFFKISIGAYLMKDQKESFKKIRSTLTESLRKAAKYPFSHYILGEQEEEIERQKAIQLYSSLKNSIFNEELILKYQPILNSKSKKIEFVETLTRWVHSVNGNISPDIFIPIAETSGLILTIGEWVMKNAISEISILKKVSGIDPDCKLTINVSPVQLNHKEITEKLLEFARRYEIAPDRILIEITETSIEGEDNYALDRLREQAEILHLEGFQIAIDDFGKGHSNFSRLEQIPSDIVKIDKNLVFGALRDPSKIKILTSIVGIIHTMDKKVILEGIENQEYEKIAMDTGADYLQGYHYFYPMNIRGLSQVFEKSPKVNSILYESKR